MNPTRYGAIHTPQYPSRTRICELTDLRRTIHTYVAEATDRFIIGDLDIDTEWDDYVKQLEQIGLSRYLKILQDNL